MDRFRINGLKRHDERGQGMTEYIILVGVIAILLIIVAYKYGDSVHNLFTSAQTELESTNSAVSTAGAEGVKTDAK